MDHEGYKSEYESWQSSVKELDMARDAVQHALASFDLEVLDGPKLRFEIAQKAMKEKFDILWTAYKITIAKKKKERPVV